MKLITQPEDGVAPLLSAVKRAKRTLDIVVFRMDVKELEEAITAAWKSATVRGARSSDRVIPSDVAMCR